MFIPVNLRYTNDHLWLRDVGRQEAYVGMSDYGQKELGRIDFIEIYHEGKKKKGETFGVIYGANKSIGLIMPFPGRVLLINPEIELHPDILNSDPYHYWIVMLTATTKLPEAFEKHYSADQYRNAINESKKTANDI